MIFTSGTNIGIDTFWITSRLQFLSSWNVLEKLKKVLIFTYKVEQGMVDGSASKPALRQDTGFMVEKTYLDIAPYLGAFGAYLMPQ